MKAYSKIPNFVLRPNNMTAFEKLVYIALISRAGKKGTCFPSVKTISKDTSLSAGTVFSVIKKLEASGMLIKQTRTRDDGGKTSNLYTISCSDY